MLYDNKGNAIEKVSRVNLPTSMLKDAEDYIKGAVHGHYKNSSDEPFSVRLLFGGINGNWNGTPLQAIYEHYKAQGHASPEKIAAQKVGYLLKSVLINDKKRSFCLAGKDTGTRYKAI